MSSTDPTSPTPRLKAREAAVLEYLRENGDEDGCCPHPRTRIAAALGVAPSTVQLAIKALLEHGLLDVQGSRGGVPNAYCVTPAGPTEDRPNTDREPTDRVTDRPTDSDSPLACERTPPRSSPLPTPSHGVSGNLIPETTDRPTDRPTEEPTDRPTDRPTEVVSLGRAAAAAVCDGAAAAGRPVEANLAQVGKAAKDLEAEGEEIVTILRAATRVGVAGTTDLRTAVEAVKEGRALPGGSGTAAVEDGARTASCIRMLLGTWPRARIDAALWEEELGRVQERFLLAAMRAIAKDGAEFPPHWGQVYRKALEVGQPIIAAERSERARRAELEREHARQAAS